MKLNKKLELGILAVGALKGRTAPTSVTTLSAEIGTTVNFLEQIMRLLRVSGLVTVKRGPGGGYVLVGQTVTALQVAKAVGKLNQGIDLGDTSAANKLRLAITEAYQNTTI